MKRLEVLSPHSGQWHTVWIPPFATLEETAASWTRNGATVRVRTVPANPYPTARHTLKQSA
jgi:hypothetical protein